MRNALLVVVACGLVVLAVLYRLSHERAAEAGPRARTPVPDTNRENDAALHALAFAQPAPLDAAQLTARARHELERDPAAALRDIAQADRLAGAHDEARRALEIEALVRSGRVGHARTLTEAFYRAYPGSARGAMLERLTGAHPRP